MRINDLWQALLMIVFFILVWLGFNIYEWSEQNGVPLGLTIERLFFSGIVGAIYYFLGRHITLGDEDGLLRPLPFLLMILYWINIPIFDYLGTPSVLPDAQENSFFGHIPKHSEPFAWYTFWYGKFMISATILFMGHAFQYLLEIVGAPFRED